MSGRGPIQLAEHLTTADPATCDLSLWQAHFDGIGRRMAQRFLLLCPEGPAHPNFQRFLQETAEEVRQAQREQLQRFDIDDDVVTVAELAIVDAFLAAVAAVYAAARPGGSA